MLSRRALARLLKMRYRFEYVFRCLDPQVGEIYNPSLFFDASVTLAGFSDSSLSLTFPSHHGSVISPLPAPHSLIPASDRSSTLRGISSVSGWTGGGEDNLGFKRTRKRFVIETHHLDVEGGVGERRTTPAGIVGGRAREETGKREESYVLGRASRARVRV
ncbi:hypothetical protein EDB84DRAFT_1475728, partial [Lactarius hengduanensis]